MKLLAIIFSLYIFILPCLPCADEDECANGSNAAQVFATSNKKEHQHKSEACNPFCSCVCCGQVYAPALQLNETVLVKPALQKLQYFYNTSPFFTHFSGNIWQPPKLT